MKNEILRSGQFHTHTYMVFDGLLWGPAGGGPMLPFWILKHLVSVFINACCLLLALSSLWQFGRGRLSLVVISFYALWLLFGPCRLSEFTMAEPLLWHVSLTLCDNIPLNMSEDSSFKDIHNYNTWKKTTFWSTSHVTPGDKTISPTKQPMTGTFYLLNEVKNISDILSFKY